MIVKLVKVAVPLFEGAHQLKQIIVVMTFYHFYGALPHFVHAIDIVSAQRQELTYIDGLHPIGFVQLRVNGGDALVLISQISSCNEEFSSLPVGIVEQE